MNAWKILFFIWPINVLLHNRIALTLIPKQTYEFNFKFSNKLTLDTSVFYKLLGKEIG